MAAISLVVLGGVGAGAVAQCDTANTPNAVVQRDASGNISASQATLIGVVNTGKRFASYPGSNYAASATAGTEEVSPCDATAGVMTLTLPPSAGNAGCIKRVFKLDSSGNLVTVKGNASELINGANTYTGLSAQYNHVTLFCNGTQWYII